MSFYGRIYIQSIFVYCIPYILHTFIFLTSCHDRVLTVASRLLWSMNCTPWCSFYVQDLDYWLLLHLQTNVSRLSSIEQLGLDVPQGSCSDGIWAHVACGTSCWKGYSWVGPWDVKLRQCLGLPISQMDSRVQLRFPVVGEEPWM